MPEMRSWKGCSGIRKWRTVCSSAANSRASHGVAASLPFTRSAGGPSSREASSGMGRYSSATRCRARASRTGNASAALAASSPSTMSSRRRQKA